MGLCFATRIARIVNLLERTAEGCGHPSPEAPRRPAQPGTRNVRVDRPWGARQTFRRRGPRLDHARPSIGRRHPRHLPGHAQLGGGDAKVGEYLDQGELGKLVTQFLGGDDERIVDLWRIFSVESWLRRYF